MKRRPEMNSELFDKLQGELMVALQRVINSGASHKEVMKATLVHDKALYDLTEEYLAGMTEDKRRAWCHVSAHVSKIRVGQPILPERGARIDVYEHQDKQYRPVW